MGHTNSTTNYSLPQFVTTDKPAWLTDINNAFSAIDTGMHNAQTKANTADTNASQALLDAASASSAASAADAKGAGAIASIADTFQTTETYAVGDYVIYNSLLYVCSVAVTEPGSWTGSSNWIRATVEGMVSDLTSDLTAEDIPLNDSVGAPTTASAIDALKTATLTMTMEGSFRKERFTGGVNDKLVNLSASIGGIVDVSLNNLTKVASISKAPTDDCIVPAINVETGTTIGYIRVYSNGDIKLYKSASGNYCGFSVCYLTT